MDLSVELGSLCLNNPVIAASGTFGYGLEYRSLVDLNALGGFHAQFHWIRKYRTGGFFI